MTEKLVTQGLELYAAGDHRGAARVWLEACRATPDDPRVQGYLQHLRSVAPDAVAEAEAAMPSPDSAPTGQSEQVAPAREDTGEQTAASASALPIPVPVPVPMPPQLTPVVPDAIPQSTEGMPEPSASTPSTASTPLPSGARQERTPPTGTVAAGNAGPWDGAAKLGPAIEVRFPGEGLGFIAAANTVTEPGEDTEDGCPDLDAQLKEFLDLHDFSGALAVAKQLLAADPGHIAARKAQAECREMLEQMLRSKVGDYSAVPEVSMSPEEIIWLDLDHRSGFLLAQVDGFATFEEIVELSGMDRLDALGLLAGLLEKGAIKPR